MFPRWSDLALRSTSGEPGQLDAEEQAFVRSAARELRARPRGTTLVLAGPRQPPELQLLAYALNLALGNLASTLHFTKQDHPQLLAAMARAHPDQSDDQARLRAAFAKTIEPDPAVQRHASLRIAGP